MTPSPACAAFIRHWESCRLVAYRPTAADVWTIGWGATGAGVAEGVRWTQAQADARFAADLARFGAGVWSHITALTTQDQFDALVALAFNIGLGAFAKSGLRKLHNSGDYAGAASRFGLWDMQNHLETPGLTRRRQAEAAMYRGEDRGRDTVEAEP